MWASIGIGLLIEEGKIKLDDRLMELLPEFANGEQDEWLKNCEVGIMMNKRAEFFMDDYVGFVGGLICKMSKCIKLVEFYMY